MIFGNVDVGESAAAYDPLIDRAIAYCRNTDVSQMHESRFFPEGEDFEVLICERTPGRRKKRRQRCTGNLRNCSSAPRAVRIWDTARIRESLRFWKII